MQHNYIADQLMALSAMLKTYDSLELTMAAMTLTLIGAEIRKHARPQVMSTEMPKLAEPPKTNGNGGLKVKADRPLPVMPPSGARAN